MAALDAERYLLHSGQAHQPEIDWVTTTTEPVEAPATTPSQAPVR
jgi:hypothetical protein